MTGSPEAHVPHDPKDLRLAAKAVRLTASGLPGGSDHAARLEAWANIAPLEAAVIDAAKAWADLEYGTGNHYDNAAICESFIDAVRALQEATDG